MGLLDDAIREHLDLKRTHGASEEEVARQEVEALGPVRRVTTPPTADPDPRDDDAALEADEDADRTWVAHAGVDEEPDREERPSLLERGLSLFGIPPSTSPRDDVQDAGRADPDRAADDLDARDDPDRFVDDPGPRGDPHRSPGDLGSHDDFDEPPVALDHRADPDRSARDLGPQNDFDEPPVPPDPRDNPHRAAADASAHEDLEPPVGDTTVRDGDDERPSASGPWAPGTDRPEGTAPGGGAAALDHGREVDFEPVRSEPTPAGGAELPDIAAANAERAEFTAGGPGRSHRSPTETESSAIDLDEGDRSAARAASPEPSAAPADPSPADPRPAEAANDAGGAAATGPGDGSPRSLFPGRQPTGPPAPDAGGRDDPEAAVEPPTAPRRLRRASALDAEKRIHAHADEEVAAPPMDSSGEALTDFVPSPPPPERPPGPRDEDLLEETPDFLEETPEHERLWFEQKPPRDFDFDD